MNIRLPKIFKRISSKRSRPLLIYSGVLWTASIALLMIFAAGLLLFDGYIFLFRIQLSAAATAIEEETLKKGLDTVLFDNVRGLLGKRADALYRSGEGLLTRNPFSDARP